MKDQRRRRFATSAVHAGDPHPRLHGAIVPPIWQSSTFENRAGSEEGIRYTRLSNSPTHECLHQRLAELEGSEAALATGSGMAAISAVLFANLSSGDHAIVHRTLYGGAHELFFNTLPRWGISVTPADTSSRADLDSALRSTTRLVYTESIVNPTLEVPDHDVVVAFARERGLLSVIDATFTSPVLFRPIEFGYDISIQSATKYLNGHSDVIAGSCASTRERIASITAMLNVLGGSLDPHAAFLLTRGSRTIHLRVQRQCENALALAVALEQMREVDRVYYPGLSSHPTHERALRFYGSGGGVVCFEVAGGVRAAEELISRLVIAANAPSLGGVETLVSLPARMSHSLLTVEERRAAGIAENLVRVAVGVEDVKDLIDDFRAALEAVA